jgi:hypothetical protein
MKNLILIIILCSVCSGNTYARGELKRKRELHFFFLSAADLQINESDIISKIPGRKDLTSPTTLSPNIGIEAMYLGKHRVFISSGFNFRVVPQRLNVYYRAAENGYTNSNYQFSHKMAYNISYLDWRWKAGYSAIVNKETTIDIGVGITFAFPLNGKNTDSLVSGNITDPVYKDPVAYYNVGWGSIDMAGGTTDENVATLPLAHFTMAYRALEPAIFNDRSIKFGLEFTAALGGDLANEGESIFWGPNRQVTSQSTYLDRHLAIGFFIGLEL